MPSRNDVTPRALRDDERRMWRRRLLRVAMPKSCDLTPRAFTQMHMAGILKESAKLDLSGLTPKVFRGDAPQHPPFSVGPFLFVKGREERTRDVIELSTSVLVADKRVRIATVKWLLNRCRSVLMPPALREVERHKAALHSEERSVWQAAAIAIADAVDNDALFNLAGVRQSVEAHFDSGYAKCLRRILRPSQQMLDRLQLPGVNNPGMPDGLGRELDRVLGKPTLAGALDTYMRAFGYVPWGGGRALSSVLRQWMAKSCSRENPVSILWAWADKARSPVARYHVCEAFAGNPELLSGDTAGRFWNEVAAILSGAAEGVAESTNGAWTLRICLQRHLIRVIELVYPHAEGDATAMAAMWLAEQVASLYDASEGAADEFRRATLEQEAAEPEVLWGFLVPPIRPSRLRCAVLMLSSPWAHALAATLGTRVAKLHPESMSTETASRVRKWLQVNALLWFPPMQVKEEQFAFDCGLAATCAEWAKLPGEDPSQWESLPTVLEPLQDGAAGKLLGELADLGDGMATLACGHLRVLAFTGQLPDRDVLAALRQDSVLHAFWSKASDRSTGIAAEGFLQMVAGNVGGWRIALPHIFAEAAERCSGDEERARALMMLTIVASLAGDTTSAVHRLLRGKRRQLFIDAASVAVGHLEPALPRASPWAASRVRAALALLKTVYTDPAGEQADPRPCAAERRVEGKGGEEGQPEGCTPNDSRDNAQAIAEDLKK